jgi:hypothetical protein
MKVIQLLSHAGAMFALYDDGSVCKQSPNPRYFRSPGNEEPEHILMDVSASFYPSNRFVDGVLAAKDK